MLDAVNATLGQEELLKVTRDDYFTFITREGELYGEPGRAKRGHDGLAGLLRSKVIILADPR
jgi:hypothetical protein